MRYVLLAGALATASSMIALWRALPDPLFDAPSSVVLESRDGVLLGARVAADEQWRFPPRDTVPERFAKALVLFEDRRFFEHPGVDLRAVLRALYLNLTRGRIVSGASTLSMQVIRLARGMPPRTYPEKLIEMLLALRLEWSFEKRQILGLYASHAPFGGNVVGLDAAAWRYFGRPAQALSWAEAALLAVLPNSPSLMHPGRNRARLRAKRDGLLVRLHEAGVLTPADLSLALREPLPTTAEALPDDAPHLLATLSEQQGSQGVRLVTTLDAALQRAVSERVEHHLSALAKRGIYNAAALVLDNQSFEVLAYVGNRPGVSATERGYAVDIVRRPRSTGSTLKPLLFAALLEEGELLPTTLVADVPARFGGYMPENFDRTYLGAVPARTALAQSRNVPAVNMLRRFGVGRFQALLQRMGVTTLHRPARDYGLTLILGGAEATLWEMASLYANLAHIASQSSGKETLHYRHPSILQGQASQTGLPAEIGPASAWLTLDALLEVARPGPDGLWREFRGARPIAWKTGTSYGLRDGWAVGTTPRFTVAVWVGNASGEGVAGLTGVGSAAPLLFRIFDLLDADGGWFPTPVEDLRPVEVCRDDGYLATPLCAAQTQWIPKHSHFSRASPFHRRVHLDSSGRWRVHGRCESVSQMQHEAYFVLPPDQEFYYKRRHARYRTLPPLRADCADTAGQAGRGSSHRPFELLYPAAGTRIYLPIELDGQRGTSVFEAVHRREDALLYWHLDGAFLGTTRGIHQQSIAAAPGPHRLVVVDDHGERIDRRFEILGAPLADVGSGPGRP